MLKGACINDFNGGNLFIMIERRTYSFLFEGRTLSVLSSTQVQFDPDLSIAHDLRRWYLEEGMNVEMTDLTIPSKQQENSKKSLNNSPLILHRLSQFHGKHLVN